MIQGIPVTKVMVSILFLLPFDFFSFSMLIGGISLPPSPRPDTPSPETEQTISKNAAVVKLVEPEKMKLPKHLVINVHYIQ